ncbi:uncharacterized protein LOC111075360 [Drosophila obscura]|uniref:uncharacterized protein LOC111075360 n=1 Tax=Drosophila obscura TaxID=7282 RepID=UPI001BB15CA6|nr:uncharacterized protein LOC111075360 [Drosophila obscura]
MSNFKVLLIFWCAVIMMQVQGLRIKSSNISLPSADAVDATTVGSTFGSLVGQDTMVGAEAGNGTTATALATAASTANPPAAVKASTRQEAAQDSDRAGVSGAPTVTTTADRVTYIYAPIVEESQRLAPSTASLLSELQRARRHLSLMNDAPLMARSDKHEQPPFEYHSFSPDGNHEMKEFELVSPNLMAENVQQELDYEPEMVQQDNQLLNDPENVLHGGHIMTPSEYYQKYKFPVAMPLRFHMLHPDSMMGAAIKMHHSRIISPLFQFLNGALDQALQNNHVAIDHLLGDRLELEIDTKMGNDNKKDKKNKRQDVYKKDELKKLFKIKQAAEVAPNRKVDEIVFSCPIHHEHHANANGEIVNDDVVSIEKCHVL